MARHTEPKRVEIGGSRSKTLEDYGLFIQREHPLHEPVTYYLDHYRLGKQDSRERASIEVDTNGQRSIVDIPVNLYTRGAWVLI